MMLHKTAEEDQWMLVEEIVKLAPPNALDFINPENGLTILHMAATLGTIKIVRALVDKNPYLTQIRCTDHTTQFHNDKNTVPLTYAVINGEETQKEVFEYLYPITRDYVNPVTGDKDLRPFNGEDGLDLILCLIEVNSFGIALSIYREFPDFYKKKEFGCGTGGLLEAMVEKPFAFFSGAKLMWWERYIYSLIEVDLDSLHAYGMSREKNTKKDEENPPETSNGSALSEEGFSTNHNGNVFSLYIWPYLMLVPYFKVLYNKKRMHTEAVALVQYLLTCLHKNNLCRHMSILKTAIMYGTTELVQECLREFPFLCYKMDQNLEINKAVIEERNVNLFNFMCEQKAKANRSNRDCFTYRDSKINSILHYAAILAPPRQLCLVSGAAFQMQRDLQWFKGVESILPPNDRFWRNKEDHTAQFLFSKNHADLMKDGEKWMKDTSESCMLLGALVATVAFAAAFTVPGGNISDDKNSSNNGIPVFLDKRSFMVFAIADALALFSSITSVLMFLAIYTSRFSEKDFLKSLPQKMVIGLATLFVSIATMLVSFGAAFTIVLGKRFSWAPIAVALFGCVPVFLFGFLQFPLFVGMVRSTFWPIVFYKRKASCYR
ncbi:hypothetical protein MKW92_042506 [Papaver armeniacum]|nr:hypothetical protein MKW92_042506 [Papaver armeniacum]